MSTYLWLLLLTLVGPLSRSFEERIAYYKNFWALGLSTLICATFFIAKDIYFVDLGIWGFNPEHVLGLQILNVPVEEFLFFIIIPYSCVFIYETLRVRIQRRVFRSFNFFIFGALGFALLGFANWERAYTATYCLVSGVFLTILWGFRSHPGFWFYDKMVLSYIVGLVPFFIVNGILTGTLLDRPVVWYNDTENLGIRLGTVPLEDAIYFLCMQFSYVSLYELFLNRGSSQNL